jgi:hypothetical protein
MSMTSEARLKFETMLKEKAEKRVAQQTKLIDELKDDLIAALKTRQAPVSNSAAIDLVAAQKENADLRTRLEKGKQAYQAEVRRGDDLLIERGDYAAEVLNLKADRADLKKKIEAKDHTVSDYKVITDSQAKKIKSLKGLNETAIHRLSEKERRNRDTQNQLKCLKQARADERAETNRKILSLEEHLGAANKRYDEITADFWTQTTKLKEEVKKNAALKKEIEERTAELAECIGMRVELGNVQAEREDFLQIARHRATENKKLTEKLRAARARIEELEDQLLEANEER